MKEDIRLFSTDDPAPLFASMIGVSYCDGSYHIRRTRSPLTVAEYILDGEGYVTVDGVDHPVTKDHVYILKSGVPHNYYSSAKNPWRKIFINIRGTLPTLLLKEYGLADCWLFDGAELKPTFEKIADLVFSKKSNEECQRILTGVFSELLMQLHRSRIRTEHAPEAVKLKDYLDANTQRLVGNAELAAQIYRSPDYCVKLFKKEYGTTPYDYQLEQKMQLARYMLRHTNMSVFAIAAELGYSDAHYFSGLFKRKQGACPKAYRNGSAE